MKIIKKMGSGLFFLAVAMGMLSNIAHAVPVYNPSAGSSQMLRVLDGPGLAISNLVVTKGNSQQYGTFSGGKDVLGMDSGVFINTGNLSSLTGPNNSAAFSYNNKVIYSDPDLARISTAAKYDPAILEFDIVPEGDRVNFVFAFGSEEYPEYVCSKFNDAFGLFVSGPGLTGVQNAAFVPGTKDAIAVNNINSGTYGSKADGSGCNLWNSEYYVDNGNGNGNPGSQLDGFTKTVTASLSGLRAGKSYHIKLALADASDPAYDSGAFFKWLTSTDSAPVDLELKASASTLKPAIDGEVEIVYQVHNQSALSTRLVEVQLDWPEGLSWISDDSGGTYDPATGIWSVGGIGASKTRTLKIRAKVGAKAKYTVTGEISFAFNQDPDSTPYNRTIKPSEDDTAVLVLTPVNNIAPDITSNGGGSSASISVSENQQSVTQVKATDVNGDTISYAISGGIDAGKFKINVATGVLTFVSPPDYENPQDSNQDNTYVVKVSASDGSLSDVQTLYVTVTDVLENVAPQVVSDGGGGTAVVSVPENQTAVTTVAAADANVGDALTYSISGGIDAGRFQINASSGVLSFISAPDYENPQDSDKNNVYIVQVKVSDGMLSDTQTLSVMVTNVAENTAPKIVSDGGGDAAVVSVPENQTAVTTVAATDANGDALTYSISGGIDAGRFQINATTGVLTFVSAPDYENPQDSDKNNVYIVQVKVSDGALSDVQILNVMVANVDDSNHEPKIGNPSSVLYSENDTQLVIDLETTDNTDSEGHGLVYSFDGQVDDGLFTLDTVTGQVYFKSSPDYEKPRDANKDNAYIVGVKVCDSGGACASRVIIVSVQDVDEDNDHDGMMDSVEKVIGTDPWNPDSDGDGLGDMDEVEDITEPLDHDKDGIIDALDQDDDNDGIFTKYEQPDPNGDGKHFDARDFDSDGLPDYLDADDDNDTVLTRYEGPDKNHDGNPADAQDTDNDFKPDYLDTDDDNDGSLTKDEQPDPNGDGNPADALDGNGNNIPSYLDVEEDLVVSLQLRIALQGAFESSTGLMTATLHKRGLMPTLQPYGELKTAFGYANADGTVSPFDYHGKETASAAVLSATGGNEPVDWVLIELRDPYDPTKRRGAVAALLQRDGDVVDAETGSNTIRVMGVQDGSYYVLVQHRNHLAVMSANPLNLKTEAYVLDFTHPATAVYGGNAARLMDSNIALMWGGDVNNSNSIILNGPGSDNNVILGSVLVAPENKLVNASYRLDGYYSTDVNMDGSVVYSGPDNEVNILLGNVLLHPDNLTFSSNFIIWGKVPR